MLGSRALSCSRAESRDAGGRAGVAVAELAADVDRDKPPRGRPPATFTLLGFPLCQQACPVGQSFPGSVELGSSWAPAALLSP